MVGLEGKEWVNSVVMYPFQYMDCTCISTIYCSFSFLNCHVYALSYRLLALQQNFKFMTFYSLKFSENVIILIVIGHATIFC